MITDKHHYRLTENQASTIKETKSGKRIVSYPNYVYSGEIQTIGKDRDLKTELYSSGIVRDKWGKDVHVLKSFVFKKGNVTLYMPQDKKLIDMLDRAQENLSNKNRFDNQPPVFYKVNAVEEKLANVKKTDALVDAMIAIRSASVDELLEYAMSVNMDTYGIEELQKAKGKKEKTKETDEFKLMEADIKAAAQMNPDKFMKEYNSPFRPILTLIRKAIRMKVLSYDKQLRTYFWVKGQQRTPLIQIDEAVTATEEWFAAYLDQNQSTLTEVKNNIQLAETTE